MRVLILVGLILLTFSASFCFAGGAASDMAVPPGDPCLIDPGLPGCPGLPGRS